jgi:hypothetical protein
MMHALFAPLAWSVSRLAIDPGWFLLCSSAAARVSRCADRPGTALFLQPTDRRSPRRTHRRSARSAFPRPRRGHRQRLIPLARERPDAHFSGRRKCARHLADWPPAQRRPGQLRLALGRSLANRFSGHNVVYAFLSPAPMAALWEKVRQEMPPGSLFISNSFAVPGSRRHASSKSMTHGKPGSTATESE